MKYELKLKKHHPRRAFRLGRHTVTNVFQVFELNEAEEAELKTAGPQAWIIEKKDFEKNKKVYKESHVEVKKDKKKKDK